MASGAGAPKIQQGKLQVQIEGLVLLKIIKHCQDGLPQVVSGLLVGLQDERQYWLDLTAEGKDGKPARANADQARKLDEAARRHTLVDDRGERLTQWKKEEEAGAVSLANGREGNLFKWVENQPVEKVEISNCFPKLTSHSLADKDKNRKQGHDETRHVNFLRCLQKVNMDTENVGWYRSSFYGKFISKQLVREQYLFQQQVPGAVLLVYDPYGTYRGRLALRAYRLTDKFMGLLDGAKLTAGEFQRHSIDFKNVFEQLPIQVHNSHMVHAFLYELREHRTMGCDFDRLYMEQSSRIVNDLSALGESIENYLFEGAEWQRWQREAYRQKKRKEHDIQDRQLENQTRRMKNQPELPIDDIKRRYPPIEDPDRLGAALVTTQMNQYCGSISDNITQALNKLCVAQGMHGDVK